MAIIVRMLLEPADQDDHDRLQDAVEAGMSRLGGPPEGLMFHLGYPSGQGFLLVEVWRSETFSRSGGWRSWSQLSLRWASLRASRVRAGVVPGTSLSHED